MKWRIVRNLEIELEPTSLLTFTYPVKSIIQNGENLSEGILKYEIETKIIDQIKGLSINEFLNFMDNLEVEITNSSMRLEG